MNRNKKGYSLLELWIVVLMISIVSVIAFNSLQVVRDSYAIEEDEAAIDLREISKQEFLLQGINPEAFQNPLADYGDIEASIDKSNSQLNAPGKNIISFLSANFKADRERTIITGKVIEDRGEPILLEKLKLMPPKANYFGTVDLAAFPLMNFILPENNPLGTHYRYTIDGADPTSASSIWKFSVLNLGNWSPIMKFRAFNANTRYIESDVIDVKLHLMVSVIIKREDGSSSLAVSYNEIISNSNRLGIVAPLKDPNVRVCYRINEGADLDYQGPFHIPLSSWNPEGVQLRVDVKIPHYRDSISSQEFLLNIKKEQLPMPKIHQQDMTVRSGSQIQISTDRKLSTTVTTMDGEDWLFYLRVDEL